MSLALAFGAGLLSFFSPCVLPLAPAYLAFLAGAGCEGVVEGSPRAKTLAHAGAFVLGFSAVFIAMGAAASALAPGRALIETLGGLVLVFLGLWMLGAFKASFLYRDARFHLRDKPAGFFGSFLVGAAFGAGWTPCVGPILAGILVLASREGSVGRGVLLLTAYSAGFAVPLLACAAAVESGTRLLKRVNKYLPWIEKGTGVLLVLLGVLLAARMYGVFAARLMSALRF